MRRSTTIELSLATLAIIACVAALKFAQTLLAPIVLGLVFAVVLAPFVRRLTLVGIPAALSAFAALVLTGIILATTLVAASPVLSQFIEEMPRLQFQIVNLLGTLAEGIGMTDALATAIAEMDQDEAMAAAMPGVLSALWLAPNFMGQMLIFAGTLYFFLLVRDELYDRSALLSSALRNADRRVSHYFTTVTLINLGLGSAVFLVTTLYGLPNPILWGFAAFLLNFVLYLGPISLIIALLVAGSMQFQGAMILAPALTFFALNITEAQFVTPALVGQQMRLNPLGVFLAILVGLWLWGPVGGIVALPVLVWLSALLSSQHKPVSAQGMQQQPKPA